MSKRLDKDKIKESLTVSDINTILSNLGSNEPRKDNRGNSMFNTICHSGNSYKLYYSDGFKNFHCFTNCGNMDIFQLVIQSKEEQGYNYSFTDALKYVAEVSGKKILSSSTHKEKNSNKIDDWDWLSRFKPRKKMDKDLPCFNESVLDVFLSYPHESWVNEGISHEVMKEAEIGYYFSSEAITIPHRDKNNRLVGLRQRNLLQEDIEAGRKYIPTVCNGIMHNHVTSYNWYHLNISKPNIQRTGKAIIFEGEKSCLLNRTLFEDMDFSVASCGSNISNWQVESLLSTGVGEVFIAFDKEYDDPYSKEAELYFNKLKKLAEKFAPYVRVYLLLDTEGLLNRQDSPIDQGKKALIELMKNKIEITTKEEGY